MSQIVIDRGTKTYILCTEVDWACWLRTATRFMEALGENDRRHVSEAVDAIDVLGPDNKVLYRIRYEEVPGEVELNHNTVQGVYTRRPAMRERRTPRPHDLLDTLGTAARQVRSCLGYAS
jgi:hypothetical protein